MTGVPLPSVAVARFLSQAWLDETVALSADQPPCPGASIALNVVVAGGPAGEVAVHWVVDGGRVIEARPGLLADGEVTSSLGWDDAVLIARGELDLNAAFMQGKVKIAGNMAKVMSLLPLTAEPRWRQLQARLRDVTE